MSSRRGRGRYLDGSALTSRVSGTDFRGFVKSIQVGAITLSTIQTTNFATVNPVVVGNCILICTYKSGSTTNDGSEANFVITNTTTLTATRVSTTGTALSGQFTLIEFYPGVVRSIQPFSIAIADTTLTNFATITAVNTAKTIIIPNGRTCDQTLARADFVNCDIILTNSTTVTASRVASNGITTLKGLAVEFY